MERSWTKVMERNGTGLIGKSIAKSVALVEFRRAAQEKSAERRMEIK